MHVLLPLLPLCTMARKRPSRSHPSKRKPPPKSPPKTEAKKRPATDAASSSAPKQKKSSVLVLPTPDKAPVDTNKYKLIQLPNGIRALLVHKPPTSENPPFCPRRSRRVGELAITLYIFSEMRITPLSRKLPHPSPNNFFQLFNKLQTDQGRDRLHLCRGKGGNNGG